MSTVQISARWTGEGLNYVGADTKGNEIKMGRDGMSASQLVLLGLAGCMGMDVVSILEKKRQTIADVEVQVTAQQPDEYPKPYQDIEVAFTVKGDNVDPAGPEHAPDAERQTLVTARSIVTRWIHLNPLQTADSAWSL